MHSLADLGWLTSFADDLASLEIPEAVPARVAVVHGQSLVALSEFGPLTATPSGRLVHQSTAPSDLPAVGDWVAVQARPGEGTATVIAVLPRRSLLVRKEAGTRTVAQAVAANVDTVLVMSSANDDFSARRIERFVALVWDSGARPVVVLTKTDLVEDTKSLIAETSVVAPGVDVVALSGATGDGIDELTPYLIPRQTLAMIGSSGVGKSTLANRLLGEDRLAVSEIRDDDSKGRHTTSHRELVVLPGGAILVDTPGMREVGLWIDDYGLERSFEDVTALAGNCRFGDCTHEHEPGCAVLAAIDDGTLEPARLAALRNLRQEADFVQSKASVAETRAKGRRFGKMIRRVQEDRNRERGG